MRDQKEDYQYEEAIKTLRTNIQFSGTNLQVIMLTSAVPNEGKSEISFHWPPHWPRLIIEYF